MSFADSLMAGLSLVGNIQAFLALAVGIVIGVIGGEDGGGLHTRQAQPPPTSASSSTAASYEMKPVQRGW